LVVLEVEIVFGKPQKKPLSYQAPALGQKQALGNEVSKHCDGIATDVETGFANQNTS
jgi:hypothetical protein